MKVYLSIGGNLGNRKLNLENALIALAKRLGIIVTVSHVYETEPIGFESDKQFLNMVVLIETTLNPQEIIDEIMIIENDLGRRRVADQYISRTMDIDLIFYENQVIYKEGLTVPHPRMHERKFVLIPFCDIAPDFIHPVLHQSIKEILETSKDTSTVKPLPKSSITFKSTL
jgi:2-amino-4-hydroxy-6-hydroxymethyldihydropteridine diphosphokinase